MSNIAIDLLPPTTITWFFGSKIHEVLTRQTGDIPAFKTDQELRVVLKLCTPCSLEFPPNTRIESFHEIIHE